LKTGPDFIIKCAAYEDAMNTMDKAGLIASNNPRQTCPAATKIPALSAAVLLPGKIPCEKHPRNPESANPRKAQSDPATVTRIVISL